MLAIFLPRVQGELLDFRTTNGGEQVVVQTLAIRQAEETRRQPLKLTSAQCFRAAALFVTTVEQPIDVLLDETLAFANRFGVAEQEQNTCARLQVAAGNVVQQAIEQLDRRCFVAMDPR